MVTVQVPIRQSFGGKTWLLETEYDMDFLPGVDDTIMPCKYDDGSGLEFSVASRYWNEQGKTVILIHTYIMDPEDGRMPSRWKAWWTEQDGGSLVDLLMSQGWWQYGNKANE